MELSPNPRIPTCRRPDANAGILRRLEEYRLDLNAARHIPETAIPLLLEKGRELATQQPHKFEKTAQAVMDVARHMHPYDAQRFLREGVTEETFDFQSQFDGLREKSSVSLSGLCGVQVASRAQCRGLRQAQLLPVLRSPQATGELAYGHHDHLCLATGEVDLLSQYLVGKALLRKPFEIAQPDWHGDERNVSRINLAATWAGELTQQRFAEKFALIMLSGDALSPSDDFLDIESPVRMVWDPVDMTQLTRPTNVQVEQLPHTVLLPDQVAQLKRESVGALREFKGYNRQEETALFPEQYVITVHAELVTKYRLLKIFESLVVNCGRDERRS